MLDRAVNTPQQNIVHNEYHVQGEVSFSFKYAAFAFWFWPCYVLMNFLNSNNEVVDLICSGNVFHMFPPKTLKLLFPNVVVF